MRFTIFKLPAKAKTTFCIVSAAGIAGLTFQSSNPNLPSLSRDSFFTSTKFSEKINAGVTGIVRSSRAIFTIASNVVDYRYSLLGLPLDSDEYPHKLSEVHLRAAKRILKLCETNKGFYVKAGQFSAAMRQVPTEYSATLSSLQDKAVPCDFQAIKEVLVRNLGLDLSEIFVSFDEQPIAAASIAQVHHALLKDHQEVAIKVQYPGLEHQMRVDITTMSFISKTVSWLFPEYRFEWMLEEFTKSIASELDFVQEAMNSERTAKNFRNNNVVKIPLVFWEFTTSQVLTMQFCKGHKVDDLEFLKENKINPIEVAKALAEVFAEMIFVFGFLHGDLHPGNILVSPEGQKGFSIVLLDHGIYKQLDEEFRKNYCQLWKALILLDSKKIQQLGEDFGVGKYAKYFPVMFTGRTIDSKVALGRGMSLEEKTTLKTELKSLKMEDISSFMESLPPDFLAILRADGLLRSMSSKLGASQRVRLLAYAKYALYGLTPNLNPESDFLVKVSLSKLKAKASYLQVRLLLEVLELLSWMEDTRKSFIKIFGRVFVAVSQFLLVVYSPFVT